MNLLYKHLIDLIEMLKKGERIEVIEAQNKAFTKRFYMKCVERQTFKIHLPIKRASILHGFDLDEDLNPDKKLNEDKYNIYDQAQELVKLASQPAEIDKFTHQLNLVNYLFYFWTCCREISLFIPIRGISDHKENEA